MNVKESDAAVGALKKIQKLIENDELTIFTRQEAKALREVATFWGQIKAVVVLGGALGRGLKWLVMIVAIWIAFKGGVLEWVKSSA